MNVGILGSGDVAKALAAGFLQRGDRVMLGTRDASKLAEWKAQAGDGASVGSFADTASFGEIIVLATLGTATLDVLQQAGVQNFTGKVVMDATNPLNYDGGPHLSVGFTDSLGEQVQRAAVDARVVKVFNTVGNALMVHPKLQGGPPDMFICGNDEAAKKTVAGIVESFGWNTIDMGDITQSRLLEPLCMVWVSYGIRSGRWDHAFKFIRP